MKPEQTRLAAYQRTINRRIAWFWIILTWSSLGLICAVRASDRVAGELPSPATCLGILIAFLAGLFVMSLFRRK